ncbi:MAG: adenylate/guanylate cyclase domain-containing protein [Pelobium sp.]
MNKILVVDDEADLELLIKQKFRKKIREEIYDFVFAENGLDALKKLEENPDIDMILSDINMPGMDGLTLLTKLPESYPMIRTVMVSAYGDMDNIRTAMNRGAFDFVCKPVNFTDLELTIEKTLVQVKQIKETLTAIKENNILKMYVDEHVLNFMTHKEFEVSLLANETLEATVMFVDICGFTSITENASANEVVNMINNFFDLIVKDIIHQNGHVDKFMGDAVMAVFRGKFHLDRAVDAAITIREHMKAQESIQFGKHNFKPSVSIGINSGEMISGNIGSASLKRLDYTVIGDVVNLAQRLQSTAGTNQILITEKVYEEIKESFSCKEVGEVNLKNKAMPVNLFEVVE